MGRFVSTDRLLEIQQSTDIVELISEYLPLKKAGANYKALCPFHDEKTPSFSVSPAKQIYYCFGCHKGGNVFTFLMAQERVGFPEAVKMLADRSGIKLTEWRSGREEYNEAKRTEFLRTNRLVADYYHKNLLESEAGEVARSYLAKRGFNQGIISRFLLGYAPAGWNSLIDFVRSSKISPALLEELGLILPRKEGTGYYDRFRHRVIFPIFNSRDRVIGFGGRALDKDAEPVYLNSPESALFSKGKTLYGLNFAKDAVVKKGMLGLVEGYTDVMMAHQMGFEWVVATLGTALTEHHIKSIRRFTNKVIAIYDRDRAGEIASSRTLDLFLTEEMELYVTELPEGLDPYDCLVEKGAKVFEDCIARAKDIFTCRWETFQHKYDFNKIEEKGRAIDEILETVALIPNTTRRHLTLQRLSEESKVKETVLLKRLEEIKLRGRRTVAPIAAALIKPPQNELNAAKNIIEITLNYNEGIPLVRGRLGEAELDTPSLTLIFREICRIYDEYNKVTLEMLLAVLAEQSDLVQEIVEITQRGTTGKGCNYQKFLADNLVFFDQQHKRLMVKTDLRQRIKEAHARSDKTEEERLLVELMELEKSLHPELACKK